MWVVLLLFVAAVFAIVACVALIGSAAGCQYFVRFTQHSHLSERTRRLYRILANVLVLELALSAATFLVPVVFGITTFFVGVDYANEALIIALCCIEWYPIATNILILSYVKPYRIGLMSTFRFVKYAKRNSSVSSVTLFKQRMK